MRKSNEEKRMQHEEWIKNERLESEKRRLEYERINNEKRIQHEEWLKNERLEIEKLRQENAKLAELESRLDAVLQKSSSNSIALKPIDET